MRLTISEFARLVGLAPSALRFYDDCGLLPPAEVDATNGYRYYDKSQQPRAQLLRDLREIDLPLADVRLPWMPPHRRSPTSSAPTSAPSKPNPPPPTQPQPAS